MTSVQLDNCSVELSQPLKDRPDVILIVTGDGRRSVIGDGQDLFTTDEYRQIDRQSRFDNRDEQITGNRGND